MSISLIHKGKKDKGESKRRSMVKSFTWRSLGTLDTIIISYFLTGQIKIAVSIGGIEVFTKMILYFLHERAWNYVKWGKREGEISHLRTADRKRRSIVKAILWRTIGTLDTIMISYILIGKIGTALSIGAIEIFTKMILYFFHERAWNFVNWGKREFKQIENEQN